AVHERSVIAFEEGLLRREQPRDHQRSTRRRRRGEPSHPPSSQRHTQGTHAARDFLGHHIRRMAREQRLVRSTQLLETLSTIRLTGELCFCLAGGFLGELPQGQLLEQVVRQSAVSHGTPPNSAARAFSNRNRFRTPETDNPTSAATSSSVSPS